MKIRSLPAQVLAGLLLATATLSLMGCGNVIYRQPASNYAGRPTPPSGLLERVLVSYTANGSQGGLEILDGLRNLRGNVQNTISEFTIKGFSAAQPTQILNFPEQTSGYVLSYTDGSLIAVNYSTESSTGSAASFGSNPPSVAAASSGVYAGAAEQSGVLVVSTSGSSTSLNLPNVDKVVVNPAGTIILAMVRNSNSLYRVVKLPATNNPVLPPGYIDCEPLLLPSLCVVPVAGTYDRPSNAVFSTDGNSVYVLNCGPECGGTTAGITFLQQAALILTNVPSVDPLTQAPPYATLPTGVANPLPIPGGVTVAVANGGASGDLVDTTVVPTLYVSGQQLSSGLFAGTLSTVDLTTYQVGGPYSIADGTKTRILLADDNTLWIGSSQCANGPRAALAAQQLALGQSTTQAANYNCLTMVTLPTTATGVPTAKIIPAVTQVPTSANGVGAVPVQYPNTNLNQYYYGSLTGLCWVQNYHKVYTAYGGQIHAFNTTDGSEIDNFLITVQGTVYDVAYMDAETNSAN